MKVRSEFTYLLVRMIKVLTLSKVTDITELKLVLKEYLKTEIYPELILLSDMFNLA